MLWNSADDYARTYDDHDYAMPPMLRRKGNDYD
jgi:hypothetical protein